MISDSVKQLASRAVLTRAGLAAMDSLQAQPEFRTYFVLIIHHLCQAWEEVVAPEFAEEFPLTAVKLTPDTMPKFLAFAMVNELNIYDLAEIVESILHQHAAGENRVVVDLGEMRDGRPSRKQFSLMTMASYTQAVYMAFRKAVLDPKRSGISGGSSDSDHVYFEW